MIWNWQRTNWPNFSYDETVIEPLEKEFLLRSGEFLGAYRHVHEDDRNRLRIELIVDEAVKTSEIEGEILNRDSVQSSLRNQFGLSTDNRRIAPQERGIAEMMVDLYQNFSKPLSHETLFEWHKMIMSGNRRIEVIGGYRTHPEPMQVVSGGVGRTRIHFEAPPSEQVANEMDRFISWFNRTAPKSEDPLPYLIRSGIAHIYFESIHPFEDGNGRIGRVLSEKVLAQSLNQPSLISLSYTIERNRKRYYDMLEASNKDTSITKWLVYFSETILEAQQTTMNRVNFYIGKARFYELFEDRLNERQKKVVARVFREGIDGFKGGMNAENYISITKTSRATATRDLNELVEIGVFTRTGKQRYTRYYLNIDLKEKFRR